jgi:ABC-type nitrate/sulfonate/bicarbonate transport system substrate-binding protein
VKRGIAKILLDVPRGDGPPAARHWTFPALVTTKRLLEEHPDISAGAVRAIVKTQQALRAEPQLAAKAAQRLFPAEEASLIAFEVTRDLPFYDATVTEEMVAHASRFAREMGVLEGEVRYGELVASQFAPLWRG